MTPSGVVAAHANHTWYPPDQPYPHTFAYGTGAAWAIGVKSKLQLIPETLEINTPLDGTMRLFVDMAFASDRPSDALLASDAALAGVNLVHSLRQLGANDQEYRTFTADIGNGAQYGVYALIVDAIGSSGRLPAADPAELARIETLKTFSAEILKAALVKALSRALWRAMLQGVGPDTSASSIGRVPGLSGFHIMPAGVVFPFWLLRTVTPQPNDKVRVGASPAYAVDEIKAQGVLLKRKPNDYWNVATAENDLWTSADRERIKPEHDTALVLYPDVVVMVNEGVLVSELKTTSTAPTDGSKRDHWYQARMQALACWTQLKAGGSPLANHVLCQVARVYNDNRNPRIAPTAEVATEPFGDKAARELVLTVMLLSLCGDKIGSREKRIWALPGKSDDPLYVYPAKPDDPAEEIEIQRTATNRPPTRVTSKYALVLASLRDDLAYNTVATVPIVTFFTTGRRATDTGNFYFDIRRQ